MAPDEASLGEQVLSKAAAVGISTQLDEVENLEVDIRTDPLKLVQGELDSVSITGSGMVMQKDLRMEEMQVETGKISVNPLSAAFGKIELTRPTEASAQVTLTEADLNRAFNSEYIRSKLQHLPVTIEGQATTIDVQQTSFQLPGNNKFALSADVKLHARNEVKRVAFTTTPVVSRQGQCVALENIEYTEGQDLSPELTQALVEKSGELLDLRNFELEGLSLRLESLEVQTGKLILQAAAHVEQFPSA